MSFAAVTTQDREPASIQPSVVTVGGSRGAGLLSNDTPLVIVGGSYADDLFGGSGDDKIYGGGAGDWLVGKGGADMIYGGSGNDAIFGGDDNDALYGGSGADVIYGGEGTDQIYGGSGDDSLVGGGGNDAFYLGDGDLQYVYGGSGNDTVKLQGLGGTPGVIANLDTGVAIVPGTGSWGLEGARIVFLDGVENLVGTDRDDTLTGDDQNNFLDGGMGNDTIYGGGGDDSINAYHNGSVSTLYGGDGNDSFFTSSGGFATLTGGSGADVFQFTNGVLPADNASLIGHITDFDDDFDKIDIRWLSEGGGPFEVIYDAALTAPQLHGQVQIFNQGDSSEVRIDADGNGQIDFVLQVDHPGVWALSAEDFYL